MRGKPSLIAALVCGAAVFVPAARAQSSAPTSTPAQVARLDLLRAWQLAADRDPQLKASRAGMVASAERLPQARSQLLPNVGASFSRNLNVLNTTQPNLLGELNTTHVNYTSSNDALTARQPIYRKPLLANLR
ncbi:MAG: channel protein TolC, partial [Betaproteobacteria bacterium]|nr:channel protein TolC [Betaproteobacteria bacterium]